MTSTTVLFEDEGLLVVDKPSGLLVHGGASVDEDDLVARLEREGHGRLNPVHRIDRATSGVLLLAKSSARARQIAARFAERTVTKVYWALVRGVLEAERVEVDHPVPKDEGQARVPARSTLRMLASARVEDSPLREKRYALVEVVPHTGRFHQVRRHAKHLGHPIIGDTTYGRSEHNRFVAGSFGLARLALHARRLSIEPWLDVTSPLPEDLAGPLRALGFDGATLHGEP